ncbi:replication factor C subunit 4 [Neocloeon triangulifer]|uniref:replication factor C subunit 4 n=1 Tax=Neocloeon triangulifer TaxID=2078957 RepID=UPI00286F201C|nr:replication factor C subunit 4 [Neocloeon triangulifer]
MEGFLKTGKLGANAGSSGIKGKAKADAAEKKSKAPWVEKYRPRTVEEVVAQPEVVSVLQQVLSKGADLPNLLLYGPPGTGKTSTIMAAARQLFGDLYRERVLELNASDERGIQVIREKVKQFAQLAASSERPDGRKCPGFKIVILDEADSMTKQAQSALRRTMERESKSTRFCLVCNYVSRIIEPITSRCAKFRFKPLSIEQLTGRLEMIAKEEGVAVGPEAIEAVISTSGGDLRRAITCLQSCARLKSKGVPVEKEEVVELMGVVPGNWIHGFMEVAGSKNYDKVETFVNNILLEAYSASQIMLQLHDRILDKEDITDESKAEICEKLAVCMAALEKGADEYLQLMALACTMMYAF